MIRLEDLRIIQLFGRRDESAIHEVKTKYGGYCFRVALNLLSHSQDAEECVNDAYLAAWDAIPPACPKSLKTFLGRITRNLAIDRYRASQAQKRGAGMTALLSELEDCLPDGNDLEAQVDARALTAAIDRWLDALSEEDRALFVRRYWQGDSLKELAEERQCRPQELAQRMLRLRKSLKLALEREGFGER